MVGKIIKLLSRKITYCSECALVVDDCECNQLESQELRDKVKFYLDTMKQD